MTQHTIPIIIEIDEQRFEISTDQLDGLEHQLKSEGVYMFRDQHQSYEMKVIHFDLISGKCTVSVDGQIKEISIIREIDVMIEKMGLNVSHSKKQHVVSAPMPGLVTSIKATIGDHVEKGTPLIILEAMKMENVISAPHDAVIKSIRVSMGQAVERGLPLVELM